MDERIARLRFSQGDACPTSTGDASMRWPLRIQILVPLATLMLFTLAGVSVLNAYLWARLFRQQIQEQLSNIVRKLKSRAIPLPMPGSA